MALRISKEFIDRYLDNTTALAPVFIVGAGRSGTTLLYKMLCLHPDIAWISNYVARLPSLSWLSVLNRVTRLSGKIRRSIWFGKDSNAYFTNHKSIMRAFPSPVEGERIFRRCGIPRFPGVSWRISEAQEKCIKVTFEKIRLFQGCKVFLSKRTANNRRIPQLYKAFSGARFIHIIRDGRAVANSLLRVGWWMDHNVWWWHQKSPRQWQAEGKKPIEMAARNWVEEVREIQSGLEAVPCDQVFEVRYENLPLNLENILKKVIHFVGIDVETYWVDEVKSLQIGSRNVHWRKNMGQEEIAILLRIQSELLNQLGYV